MAASAVSEANGSPDLFQLDRERPGEPPPVRRKTLPVPSKHGTRKIDLIAGVSGAGADD
jgi:hypothetical protein